MLAQEKHSSLFEPFLSFEKKFDIVGTWSSNQSLAENKKKLWKSYEKVTKKLRKSYEKVYEKSYEKVTKKLRKSYEKVTKLRKSYKKYKKLQKLNFFPTEP